MTHMPEPVSTRPGFGALRKPAAPVVAVAASPRQPTYAGVGSRETPPEVLATMEAVGQALAARGHKLLSGAAPGADAAFERGCDAACGAKEIFIPWKGFQGRQPDASTRVATDEEGSRAFEIAAGAHLAWQYLRRPVKLLMARNSHQVLGWSLDEPVDFVLAWTPDGAETLDETGRATGGTGQAIRLANLRGIPVINMGRTGWEERLGTIVGPETVRRAVAPLDEDAPGQRPLL